LKNIQSITKKLLGLLVILAAAVILSVSIPRTVSAAAKRSHAYSSESVQKVKTYNKKFKILGKPYNTKTWNLMSKGWYTYKINSKTKFKQLVDTETGQTKKLSKAKALKNLKKKKFIMVYITFKTNGTVTEMLFGV